MATCDPLLVCWPVAGAGAAAAGVNVGGAGEFTEATLPVDAGACVGGTTRGATAGAAEAIGGWTRAGGEAGTGAGAG